MKKCIVFSALLLVSQALYSQGRLHTVGARTLSIQKEHVLCLDAIFAQSEDGVSTIAGYYSTDKREGFSLNKKEQSIQYTSFDWKIDSISGQLSVEIISRSKVWPSEHVFNAINDMLDLAVSTSSPQMMYCMIGDVSDYFAYGYDIAGYEAGGYDLVEVSKNICQAVKSGDVNAINSICHKIKGVGNQYKRLYEISECQYDGQPQIYVGTIYERVWVCVRFEDLEFIDIGAYRGYIAVIKKVAAYMLYHTDHRINLSIIVGKTPKACTVSRDSVQIWCAPEDYSCNKIISVLDKFLITE